MSTNINPISLLTSREMPKSDVQWKRRGIVTSTNKPEKGSTRTPVKRHRELDQNIKKAVTTSYEYTDEESSASPDTDASSSDNSREATPQYEITDEAPPPETTTISEARAVVHMEDLRRQLNFWHYARKQNDKQIGTTIDPVQKEEA